MTLAELQPRWWGYDGRLHGLSFLCPCCRQVRLAVAFANPPDGGRPHDLRWKWNEEGSLTWHVHAVKTFDVAPGALWTVDGQSFESMTLTPSVDASKSGHWHGHITNGEVRP